MFRVGDKVRVDEKNLFDNRWRNTHVLNISRNDVSGRIIGVLDRRGIRITSILIMKLDKPKSRQDFTKNECGGMSWWPYTKWFNQEPDGSTKLGWVSILDYVLITKLGTPLSYRQIFREALTGA